MPNRRRSAILAAALAALGLSACGKSSEFDNAAASDEGPAKVQPIEGAGVSRVTLSPRAAQRLGIEMGSIGVARDHEVIPYAAVLYDAEGRTFAFTSPRRLVYVRRPIVVARIDGDQAILTKGPPPGTAVVTVGAAELLGAEYGVEE